MRQYLFFALIALGLALGNLASAQTLPPDAGMLRQQIEQRLPPALPLPKTEVLPPPPAMSPIGDTLTVSEFRFAGNRLIASENLRPVVAPWLQRPLSFAQLQEAVVAVAQTYREAGWIVRTYLPRQEIVDGVVTIQIVEAAFGGVFLEGDPARRIAGTELAEAFAQNQELGAPLNAEAMDRSLLIFGDLPGVTVNGSMRQGQKPGETDVVLKMSDRLMLTGDGSIDNTGSRSTGKERLSVNLALGSPFTTGDQINANLLHTEGSDYGRLAYSRPLGYDGWRAGVNASSMRYKLVGSEFSALGAAGDSDTFGIDLNYPIYRFRLANLYFTANAEHKNFDNRSGGATTTRYAIDNLNLGINGNLTDKFAGGGTNSVSLTWGNGKVDLAGSPNEAADALSTRTAGSFKKLRYALSRLQAINDRLRLSVALSGQVASKNLDSGEKFYLGGASGVRAYPSSEGGGADGRMFNLELLGRLGDGFSVSGFYDHGSVTVNRDNDFAGGAKLNRYSLAGAGLALGWQSESGASIKLTCARRIGSNPNPTLTGKDQDGSLIRNRLWLSASLPF